MTLGVGGIHRFVPFQGVDRPPSVTGSMSVHHDTHTMTPSCSRPATCVNPSDP